MSFAQWQSIETPPAKAGTYLVGNRETHVVRQARYMPKNKEWKFPSAAQAFKIQAWAEMPAI